MAAGANAGYVSVGGSREWASAAPEVPVSSISGVLNLTRAITTTGTDHVCGLVVLQRKNRAQ